MNMTFDSKKFLKEKFSPRTEAVPVPDLKDYFGEGKECVWIVRGLTGQELGRCVEAAERHKTLSALVNGIAAGMATEITDAIKSLVGVSGETPTDISKRIDQLVIASIDPICTMDLAVRLCEVFPVEFYMITNKITELTGQGQVPGKRSPSGEIKASKPASPFVMPEGDSSMKQDQTSSPTAT